MGMNVPADIMAICDANEIVCLDASVVNGGDINTAYKLQTGSNTLFLKLNNAKAFPGMFRAEADGLNSLAAATTLKVPAVVAIGEYKDQQYICMEWLQKAAPSKVFWSQMASGLAELHRTTSARFGFSSSNFIGSLPQNNQPLDSWALFYAERRVLPLVKQLINRGAFDKKDIEAAETLGARLAEILPAEPPALLHGDLWAGNMMPVSTTQTTLPAIYDPAVYFGHREMDIGMTLLFGGFDKRMYDAYNEIFPLEKDWRQRVELTQLYPLLVHALLFGGGYVAQCRSILQRWK